jgi:hypothetical protein
MFLVSFLKVYCPGNVLEVIMILSVSSVSAMCQDFYKNLKIDLCTPVGTINM